MQGHIYRGSWGSLSYPGFLEISKEEAVKEENFEDFPTTGYPGFKMLNTALNSEAF